jgi:hypothetical protein
MSSKAGAIVALSLAASVVGGIAIIKIESLLHVTVYYYGTQASQPKQKAPVGEVTAKLRKRPEQVEGMYRCINFRTTPSSRNHDEVVAICDEHVIAENCRKPSYRVYGGSYTVFFCDYTALAGWEAQ